MNFLNNLNANKEKTEKISVKPEFERLSTIKEKTAKEKINPFMSFMT